MIPTVAGVSRQAHKSYAACFLFIGHQLGWAETRPEALHNHTTRNVEAAVASLF